MRVIRPRGLSISRQKLFRAQLTLILALSRVDRSCRRYLPSFGNGRRSRNPRSIVSDKSKIMTSNTEWEKARCCSKCWERMSLNRIKSIEIDDWIGRGGQFYSGVCTVCLVGRPGGESKSLPVLATWHHKFNLPRAIASLQPVTSGLCFRDYGRWEFYY